jgi:hypothetical protein
MATLSSQMSKEEVSPPSHHNVTKSTHPRTIVDRKRTREVCPTPCHSEGEAEESAFVSVSRWSIERARLQPRRKSRELSSGFTVC